MALSSGKKTHAHADPMVVDFENGTFIFDDDSTIKLPEGIKFVEQDPEKVNMIQRDSPKQPVKIIVNDSLSFFVIAGATKQFVLDGIRRCELGV